MTARHLLFWSLAQFVILLIIELGGLIILARLLTPAEVGVFAVSFAVIQLCQFLANFGLRAVIVRADIPDITFRRRVVGLIILCGGGAAAGLLGALAVLPDSLFGAPARHLIVMMLPLIPLGCLGMSGDALLTRDLRFRAIFAMHTTAAIIYQTVAIPLAIHGRGASSLAIGVIAGILAHAVFATLLTRGTFLVRPSFRGLGSLTRVASIVFATAGLRRFGETAVQLAIGRLAGYGALGQFTRSTDLVRRSNRAVQTAVLSVLFPFVLNAQRHGRPLRPIYLSTITYVSAICWPVAGGLILFSEPLVLILLGPQWPEVPALLRILALGIVVFPLHAGSGAFAIALTREGMLLKRQAVVVAFQIAAAITLAPVGLKWVCAGMVGTELIFALFCYQVVSPQLDVKAVDIVQASWRSALAGLGCTLPLIVPAGMMSGEIWPDLLRVVLFGAIQVGLWLALILALGHPLRTELHDLLAKIGRQSRPA